MNNREIQQSLRDATEEISRLNSSTVWEADPTGTHWRVRDDDGNHLGRVNAVIDYSDGIVVLNYQYDRFTYRGVGEVADATIDALNLSDPEELDKIAEFDNIIAEAHGL